MACKSVIEQLDEFLETHHRNKWLKDNDIEIYVRKYKDTDGVYVLDIANVNARKPGKGAFTKFLEYVEGLDVKIKIENVVEDRFADYFRKRSYIEIPAWRAGLPVSFTKDLR